MSEQNNKIFLAPPIDKVKIGTTVIINSPINLFLVYAFELTDRSDSSYELVFKITAASSEKWTFATKQARDSAYGKIVKVFSAPFQGIK